MFQADISSSDQEQDPELSFHPSRVQQVIPNMLMWTSSTYLNHHLNNVGDEGMAKDSKYSIQIFAMMGETGGPMAAPFNYS